MIARPKKIERKPIEMRARQRWTCFPPRLFALLMGLSNFGTIVGIYNGVALLHLFGGVEAPEFRNLPAFVLARTLCYLAPLALVFVLVPTGSPDDDVAADDAKPGAGDGPAGALELVAKARRGDDAEDDDAEEARAFV